MTTGTGSGALSTRDPVLTLHIEVWTPTTQEEKSDKQNTAAQFETGMTGAQTLLPRRPADDQQVQGTRPRHQQGHARLGRDELCPMPVRRALREGAARGWRLCSARTDRPRGQPGHTVLQDAAPGAERS